MRVRSNPRRKEVPWREEGGVDEEAGRWRCQQGPLGPRSLAKRLLHLQRSVLARTWDRPSRPKLDLPSQPSHPRSTVVGRRAHRSLQGRVLVPTEARFWWLRLRTMSSRVTALNRRHLGWHRSTQVPPHLVILRWFKCPAPEHTRRRRVRRRGSTR